MVSENTVLTKVINRKLKKCGFCNKELKPIGFDYLYENFSPDCIEYECYCQYRNVIFFEFKNERFCTFLYSIFLSYLNSKKLC